MQSNLFKVSPQNRHEYSIRLSFDNAFIWDDCRQTEEYGVLTSGLETLKGLEKAILISRPQRMGDASQPNSSSNPSET